MSFIGCISVLMEGSELEQILKSAFKGVESMLNGKAWPKAVRGLRMICVRIASGTSAQTLLQNLEKARSSRSGCHWVDCLIIPVVIIHPFIRAEREGGWFLHLYALKRMIPYFFAAAHWNYADSSFGIYWI